MRSQRRTALAAAAVLAAAARRPAPPGVAVPRGHAARCRRGGRGAARALLALVLLTAAWAAGGDAARGRLGARSAARAVAPAGGAERAQSALSARADGPGNDAAPARAGRAPRRATAAVVPALVPLPETLSTTRGSFVAGEPVPEEEHGSLDEVRRRAACVHAWAARGVCGGRGHAAPPTTSLVISGSRAHESC
jgi:hypothetical protein